MELRHSETIGKVVEALAKASSEFQPIIKGQTNPFYGGKYADLSSLIEATRPALSANGLVVLQTPRVIANRAVEITSMLAHSSGEFMAFDISFPAWQDVKEDNRDGSPVTYRQRFDAQTIGSAITYGRRYSYQSLLNISAEEDDDGNATVRRNGKPEAVPEKTTSKPPQSAPAIDEPKITQTEQNAFWSACKKSGKDKDQVRAKLAEFGASGSDEIRKKDFPVVLRWALEAA